MQFKVLVVLVAVAVGCTVSSGDKGNSSGTEETEATTPQPVQRSRFRAGKALFAERCAVCHGQNADGQGTMAQSIEPPKPADFRENVYARMPIDSIRAVIVRGGAATGRNPRMPAWEDELTEPQIEAVTAFVRSVGRFGQVPTERQVRESSWFVN